MSPQPLSDASRFLAYAFARATHEDMKLLRAFLDDDDLREARSTGRRRGSSIPAPGLTGIPSSAAIPRRLCQRAASGEARHPQSLAYRALEDRAAAAGAPLFGLIVSGARF